MKVLMTADTVGGVWTYAMDLIRALAPWRVDVTLATMGAPLSSDQRAEADAIPSLTVHESRYKLEWMEEPWDDVAAAGDWLLSLEREVRPDLIHLNGYAHGALPFRAPKLIVAHSCVPSWWRAVHSEDAPPSWDSYRREVTMGLQGVRRLIAPTQAMLGCIRDHYRADTHGEVIFNGRASPSYAPQEKEPLVFSAGRIWDEAKNVHALTAIAADLPWPVCVAGDSTYPGGTASEFPNVRLLGRLSAASMTHWLGRASIYALPAKYEPFGLSVLEAALAGCALVLGDIASLREVWGDAAIFVPANDHSALRDAIASMIDDPELCAEMARRALKRAQPYTPQRMAASYLEVYQELTGKVERWEPFAVVCGAAY